MKTQTTQLSLLDTTQVTGGITFAPALPNAPINGEGLIEATEPNMHITQALKENGGRFQIVS